MYYVSRGGRQSANGYVVCRLNHPVKKVKHDEGGSWEWVEEGGLGGRRGEDLYAGHTHTKMAPVEPPPLCSPHYLKDGKVETNQVKKPFPLGNMH